MTKRIFLSALLALSLGNGVARADAPAENAEQTVFDAITSLRARQNLPPLVRDPALDEAALIHAEDMAAHDYVDHVSERTGDPASRARAVGASVRRVGENVARAESTAAAVASLASSDAHRQQILSADYTTVGIAVVEDEEGFYVVEVFGVPLAAPTAAPVAPIVPPPAVADLPSARPVAPAAQPVAPAAQPIAPSTSLEAALAAAVTAVDPNATVTTTPTDCGADCPDSEVEAVDTVVRTVPSTSAAQPIAVDPAQVTVSAPSVQASAQATVRFPQQPSSQNAAQPSYAPASAASPAAPIVMLQGAPQRNVAGYWVQAGGRWWYYPVPPNAQPGQTLTPSTTAPAAPNLVPQGPTYVPYAQPQTQPQLDPHYAPQPRRRGLFPASPRRW